MLGTSQLGTGNGECSKVSRADYLFTSESVSEGHPDKVCDQISDAILDAILAQDPNSRVACESLIKTGLVVIAGEITTKAQGLNFGEIAKRVIHEIGYTTADTGFSCDTAAVVTALRSTRPLSVLRAEKIDALRRWAAGRCVPAA